MQQRGPAPRQPAQGRLKEAPTGSCVFIYHGPAEMPDGGSPSEDDMKAVMAEWMAWAGKVGGAMTDFGTPLGNGVMVTPGGGTALLASRPPSPSLWTTLTPGGCTVEVLESEPIPGM